MTNEHASTADRSELAQRLEGVSVSVRHDLEVTRHLFQQTPTYIVRDPVTFSTHRLSVQEYEVLTRIDTSETLGEAFQTLVNDRTLDADEEEDFYNITLYFHRATLLNLPFSDHASLFKRFERRRRSRALATAMSPFFLRVPLWNPDPFLDATHKLFGWVFSVPAIIAWAATVAIAAIVAFAHRDELAAPLLTALEFENLPILWLVLVVLKVLHEFGHAYACKHFGGKVPDMGAMFIVGTPAAYVDASAAWGFQSVYKRMMVNLAGVYVEMFCAAMALFVWVSTAPGLLNSVAYQVVLMASVVTLAFNANPLAKFDGYYVLSDLVGIPNLRQRASEQLARIFNRVALGLPQQPSEHSVVTRAGLCVYGIAAAMYRITVLLGLSAVVATKFFALGLTMAAIFITTSLYGIVTKSVRHLVLSEATAPVRRRAIAVGVIGLAAAAIALFAIPTRQSVRIDGTLARETERTLFASARGFIVPGLARPGALPPNRLTLVSLQDPSAESNQEQARAERVAAELRIAAAPDAVSAAKAAARLGHAKAMERRSTERLAESDLTRRADETLIAYAQDFAPGMFVPTDTPVATLGSGPWVIHALASADQIAAARIQPGDAVRCRTNAEPATRLRGTVTHIAPAANRTVANEQLTQAAGGPILVDQRSHQATQPYVQLTVRLDAPVRAAHGMTAWVELPSHPEPLASAITRSVRRFADDLSTR